MRLKTASPLRLSWMAVLLVSHTPSLAQFPRAKLLAGTAPIEFDNVSVNKSAAGCKLSATVNNRSVHDLSYMEISARIGDAVFPLKRFHLKPSGMTFATGDCPPETPTSGTARFSYLRGISTIPGADKAHQTALNLNYLYSLLVVRSPFATTILASDSSCANSYAQAVEKGGLDGRRLAAEIVKLGCGKEVPNDSAVLVEEEKRGFSLVVSVETKHSGWVSNSLLHKRESPTLQTSERSGGYGSKPVDPPRWREVKRWTGDGTKTTESFQIGAAEWRISYQVKSSPAGTSDFSLWAEDSRGSISPLATRSTPGVDTTYVRRSGQFSLKILASSGWEVIVEEFDQ